MAKQIVLETEKIKATLNVATMAFSVLDKVAGYEWQTPKDDASDYGYREGGVSYEVSFASKEIERRVVKVGENDYKVVFENLNCFVGFGLTEGRDDEITVKLGEENCGLGAVPMAGSYPRNLQVPVSADGYTIIPVGSGMMIPGDFNKRVRATFDSDCLEENEVRLEKYADIFLGGRKTYWWDIHDQVDMDVTKFHGRPVLNMFGAKMKDSAYLAIVDTRFDWHLGAKHDPGEMTQLRHFWLPSMGNLNYDRVVRYRMCPGADYVELAKVYREDVIKRDGFKSLKEKAAELPHLDDSRGGVDAGISFLHHDLRRELYNIVHTFEQGIGYVKDFKKRSGFEKVVIGVRGWQKWGHDHHYPSLLPPNVDCGGVPGFVKLGNAVRDMGYNFELGGDNYHDIAYESPDFDEKVLMRNADGSANRYNMWASGMTSYLAMPWAMKFLRRNFELGKMDYPQTMGLLELVPFNYYWIGNWGSDCKEDYNPECLIDSTEHHRWVLRILSYIRSKGKVVEMEHCSEWCMKHLDRIKMREPHLSKPNEDRVGDKQGIAIPLWYLVFNDSSIIHVGGGWEKQLCYGGHPKLRLPLSDDFESSGMLERLKIQAKLNEQIMYDELVKHEFVGGDEDHERCEYSSGVTVTCNMREHTYCIEGHPDFDGKVMKTPGA